ncbi:MAG: response regulator [Deltaproteobacteria bacterium]|nr:response regulator [Deltaproteobacteria bacterium]
MQTNKKILVVDDEAHVRRVIELKLKNRGYQVLTATNGREGLDLIRIEQPDAVIVDLNMPVMDGESLCRLTDPLKRERPFLTIVMTARISPEERTWIEEMNETQFVEKPFSPSNLLERINAYFGIR